MSLVLNDSMPRINLEQFGLTDEESKVYLALIKLGSASAIKISLATNLKRTTVYYHIENLIGKSLVVESYLKNKKSYQPAPPTTLKAIIDRRTKELEDQKNNLNSIISRIQAMTNKKPCAPDIQILKGKDGLVEVMNDVLDTKENIYYIGSHDIVLENEKILSVNYFLQNFTAKRRQKGGTVAYIISDFSKLTLRQQREEDTAFRHILIWPELNGTNGGLVVYGSKVVVYSVDAGVTIYSLDNLLMADIIRIMFGQLFKPSTKYK